MAYFSVYSKSCDWYPTECQFPKPQKVELFDYSILSMGFYGGSKKDGDIKQQWIMAPSPYV